MKEVMKKAFVHIFLLTLLSLFGVFESGAQDSAVAPSETHIIPTPCENTREEVLVAIRNDQEPGKQGYLYTLTDEDEDIRCVKYLTLENQERYFTREQINHEEGVLLLQQAGLAVTKLNGKVDSKKGGPLFLNYLYNGVKFFTKYKTFEMQIVKFDHKWVLQKKVEQNIFSEMVFIPNFLGPKVVGIKEIHTL